MQRRNIRECHDRLQQRILTLEKVFRKVLSKEQAFELEPEGWEEVSYMSREKLVLFWEDVWFFHPVFHTVPCHVASLSRALDE